MSVGSIVSVIAADVGGQPPLHEGAENLRGRGFQNEMEMVGHQTETEDFHGVLSLCDDEQVKPIPIVKTKNRVAFGVKKPALVLFLNLPSVFLR